MAILNITSFLLSFKKCLFYHMKKIEVQNRPMIIGRKIGESKKVTKDFEVLSLIYFWEGL